MAFVFAGLIAGLAYWYFIGCSGGTCAITSKWHNSMLFGGVFGYLIGDSIKWNKEIKENKEIEQVND